MAIEEVEVTIASDGKVTVHVKGIDGQGCLSETAPLLALLGGEIDEQELTAEAFVEVDQSQKGRLWH